MPERLSSTMYYDLSVDSNCNCDLMNEKISLECLIELYIYSSAPLIKRYLLGDCKGIKTGTLRKPKVLTHVVQNQVPLGSIVLLERSIRGCENCHVTIRESGIRHLTGLQQMVEL